LFGSIFPLIKSILENEEKNLARFLGASIEQIADYLNIEIKIIYSSEIEKNNILKAQEKIINICKRLNASDYVNAIGGQELYEKSIFEEEGLSLHFLQPELTEYQQFGNDFTPYLSIIDIMMFNNKNKIKKMLKEYTLI
jgi:hypothetical protein